LSLEISRDANITATGRGIAVASISPLT